jgi:hypothetical protein
LAYLEHNPAGCDTLMGISRWWLLKERIHAETKNIQSALDELVERGLILRRTKPYGSTTYSANRGKRK